MRRLALVLAIAVMLDAGLRVLLDAWNVSRYMRALEAFSRKALSGANLYFGAALVLLLSLALYASVLAIIRFTRSAHLGGARHR